MSDRHWRSFFWIAAAYNMLAGLPPLLVPAQGGALFGLVDPAPVVAVLLQMVGLLVINFGLGYAMVARNLEAARYILPLGIFGKLGVVVLIGWHFAAGTLAAPALAAAFGDLLFALGFIAFLRRR
ncbi:hypothetical protein D3874_24090 [Oleomonas cavernae]|uniref:Uncharacterized protein n=1 Tax=Oleomonas cavernae TaxID=2320859 RepID=A0A418WI51_9PROT|nr:hypothetical protein [Oleomonas cavernae]RJF89670.1 hypothetical protein D3874_24090 [Oleomonas cavernae]